MKVKLIPGPRDEEKIALIRTMKATLDEDEWINFFDGLANDYSNFDSMYYACENGDEMLEDQARYFDDCLSWDERYYYAARMGGYEF